MTIEIYSDVVCPWCYIGERRLEWALAAAAASVGLDGEHARAYLASNEGVRELEAEFNKARELGITSVPTFVIDGRYAIQGAQPTSTFVRVLEQVLSTHTSSDRASADSCADGVCAT